MGLKWEFPGGKVENDETFSEALLREIKEELNININIKEKIAEEKYKDDKIDIVLHYYLCSLESGTMELNEHENYAWVEKKDFDNIYFNGEPIAGGIDNGGATGQCPDNDCDIITAVYNGEIIMLFFLPKTRISLQNNE